MADEKEIKRLRKVLDEAVRKDKVEAAIKTYSELELHEPKSSRWPHKRGDLLRRVGRVAEAVGAYDRAVACYTAEGFVARAVAMAKTVIVLDPTRIDVLERVDPAAARAFLGVPQGGGGHSAILAEDDEPAVRSGAHSAVLPESVAPPAAAQKPVAASASQTMEAVVAVTPESEPAATTAAAVPPPLPRPPRSPNFSPSAATPIKLPAIEEPRPAARSAKPLTSIRPAPPALPQRKPMALDEAALFSNAADLVRAPDERLNEIRFSDLPPARGRSVPVTVVEMRTRHSLPPTAIRQARATTARDLSLMPLFPLFSDLPSEAFVELIRASQLVELGHGKHVIRRGDPSDCLFGIVEGSVQIQPPGMPPELYVPLSEGDVFGESCLLKAEPRHADIVVQGYLIALRMPKDALDALVRKHRKVAEVLLELLTRRLIGNLLNSSHLFSDVDPQTRADVANMFEVRRAAIGTPLMESGKRSDGLYIALTGRVLCKLPGLDEPVEAGAGSMFGHTSLLGEAPGEIGVRTIANMIVLRLPAPRFANVAMQHPALLAKLAQLPPLADVSL